MNQTNDQKNVIDLAQLKDTFMGDLNVIKQILSAFQDSLQHFEEEFKSLASVGNQDQLSRLVHGLKGSSANIRADNVASQAANLQKLIDQKLDYSNELDPLLNSISLLEDEINKIKGLQ
jgi:HPt (histidine-containing phosphotransfer) domain-containing protein